MESLNIIERLIKNNQHYIDYETPNEDNLAIAENWGKELNIVKNDLQELAQYRALTEQIGCPLEVVFRALKDGIYHNYTDYNYKTKLDKWFIFEMENKIAYRKGEVQIVHRFVRIIDEKRNHFESDNREICPINEMSNSHLVDIDTYGFIKWSDYKTTWWLKADKSE